MLNQYAKTFVRMQFVIWLVAAAVLNTTHDVFVAAAFLATMQVGALFGAAWGDRLRIKRFMLRH